MLKAFWRTAMANKPPHFRPGVGPVTAEQARKLRQRKYAKERPDKKFQALYRSARWFTLRRIILTRNPLCVMCRAAGRVVVASVVDHIEPHKGAMTLFWSLENLQGLCASCHSGPKRREENAIKKGEK